MPTVDSRPASSEVTFQHDRVTLLGARLRKDLADPQAGAGLGDTGGGLMARLQRSSETVVWRRRVKDQPLRVPRPRQWRDRPHPAEFRIRAAG